MTLTFPAGIHCKQLQAVTCSIQTPHEKKIMIKASNVQDLWGKLLKNTCWKWQIGANLTKKLHCQWLWALGTNLLSYTPSLLTQTRSLRFSLLIDLWWCVQFPTCGWLTDKPDHDKHDSYGWDFCQESHFDHLFVNATICPDFILIIAPWPLPFFSLSATQSLPYSVTLNKVCTTLLYIILYVLFWCQIAAVGAAALSLHLQYALECPSHWVSWDHFCPGPSQSAHRHHKCTL